MNLTLEETNVLLALCDLGVKAAGNELYRQGAARHYLAAYDKLQAQVKRLTEEGEAKAREELNGNS